MSTALPKIIRIADGTRVRIRRGIPEDREELLESFEHLSMRSRYLRFFSATPRLTEQMLARLTRVDDHDRVALVAERVDPSSRLPKGLGVARFVRLPGDEGAEGTDEAGHAEIAVTVIDEVQGLGLGRALLLSLAEEALRHGVRRFVASVLPENLPMLTLLRSLAPEVHSHREDGVEVYEIPLEPVLDDELEDSAAYVRFA